MTQTIMLALDGEAIRLKDMKTTISMQFQEQDQSGQTSSTAKAEQGIKAKEMRISGLIPFSKPDILKRLFELASAMDSAGKQKVYRVASMSGSAVGLREASFSGQLDAPEQDGKMAWLVTFTLREFKSVPEKKQARAASKTDAKTQGQNGTTSDSGAESEKLSWFEEKVLKPTDSALGSVIGGGNASG